MPRSYLVQTRGRRRTLPAIVGERPKTRGDCKDGPRPCPWVSCRYHLAIDVDGREVTLAWPPGEDGEPDLAAMPDTCALDVADRTRDALLVHGADALSHKEIGASLNLTAGEVEQIEECAGAKVRGFKSFLGASADDEEDGRLDVSMLTDTGFDGLGFE